MNNWYHIDCMFESFKTQRATTKSIETIDDIGGWETIGDLDKDSIMEKLQKLPALNVAASGTSDHSKSDVSKFCIHKTKDLHKFIHTLTHIDKCLKV